MDRFFRENLPLRSTEDINPAHPQGIGYITCYDPEERRLIITKKDFVPRDDLRVKLYRSKINGNWYYDLNFQSYPVDVNDPAYFVNYSWTVSYAMDSNKWISFHSYIPDHAFYDKKVMYTSKGNGVWSHNNDTYFNKFYGTEYPHILEIVDTQEDTAKWNNILLLTEAIKNEVEQRNTTFDGLWAYTNRQSTGKQTLKVISSDSNYIGDSVRDEFGIIRIDKRERMWNIPELYDYVTDITKSVGTTSWTYLSSEFPIDKVPNPLSTDNTKDWMGLENFRDNYLIIRFYFSLNDVLLLTKFAESNKVKST